MPNRTNPRPRVGISSCLMGEPVRFDAGHKLDKFCRDTLGEFFDLIPYCPEMAIGLGAPRPTIRLTGSPEATRVRGVKDSELDVTDDLAAYGMRIAAQETRLCGYILKKGSPSCGLTRVKVWGPKGQPMGSAAGKYTEVLKAQRPLLPMEDEGRLNDASLRESFIERIYVAHRWHTLMDDGLTPGKLVDFHTRHKFLLLSHSEVEYRALGPLVANAGKLKIKELGEQYISILMRGMSRRATRRRHTNVLSHLLGFLRRTLNETDRAELTQMIDEYRIGEIPLIVPIRFLKHHFSRHPDDFVSMQYYLDPYPATLGLRNHL
jgi:uncharacterized protein YbgA (DUF1722 family)/uncharacterized protein YbbK (DUF523 family)